MRVLSWNLAHNPGIWATIEALRDQEGFDVALLQEATPPPDAHPTRRVEPDPSDLARWITDVPGFPRKWRTAVAWWEPVPVEPIAAAPIAQVRENDEACLPESCPGAFTAVRVGATALLSVYGVWEHLVADSNASYSLASVHRTISDLTRLWFARKDPRVVIAGDWNVWRAYGDAPRWDIRQWSQRSNTIFDRLVAEGFELAGPYGDAQLERCPCGPRDDCRHVQTYWHQHNPTSTPYQTDYVAATSAVPITSPPRVITHLGDEPLWARGVSDHAPILFDVDTDNGRATP